MELTIKEFYEMQNSEYLNFKHEESYWLDLSKFAFLLSGMMQLFGGESKEVTDLIGEPPEYKGNSKKKDRKLTETDLKWIEWAKKNGYNYNITKTGIKITKSKL